MAWRVGGPALDQDLGGAFGQCSGQAVLRQEGVAGAPVDYEPEQFVLGHGPVRGTVGDLVRRPGRDQVAEPVVRWRHRLPSDDAAVWLAQIGPAGLTAPAVLPDAVHGNALTNSGSGG